MPLDNDAFASISELSISDSEKDRISVFIGSFFNGSPEYDQISDQERHSIGNIVRHVESVFARMKYPLGLAIDFLLLAQRLVRCHSTLRAYRPNYTEDDLFKDFELVDKRGNTVANTLTLRALPDCEEGIRSIEEQVQQLFHSLGRTNYPVAYVYNTGQWHKFKQLLVECFQLSEAGRHAAVTFLLALGLKHLEIGTRFARDVPRIRVFEQLVTHYPRSDSDENGGLAFQALCYGFLRASSPHVCVVTDKVRGGSRRQRRIGDIDGYYGLDLEYTAEVKDMILRKDAVEKQLGVFCAAVSENCVPGLAFVQTIDEDAIQALSEMSGDGVRAVTVADVVSEVIHWDWTKQDSAVHAFLHYLAHIEQNPKAVQRALRYIRSLDPEHSALVFRTNTVTELDELEEG